MTLAHLLVYVIDDDISIRRAIGRLLESEDYPVEMLRGTRGFDDGTYSRHRRCPFVSQSGFDSGYVQRFLVLGSVGQRALN